MKTVNIVEVGLRDGLQNETTVLNVEQRLLFLEKLINAGVKIFELGSFVSKSWVPQMAVTGDLIQSYLQSSFYNKNLAAGVLVPNE